MASGGDIRHRDGLVAALELLGYRSFLRGMRQRRTVLPPPGCTPELIGHGLALLRAQGAGFAVYDPLYPSPLDPGAYFNYVPGVGNWRMTFGNHGWPGGIYELDEDVVCAQLANLHNKGLLNGIELEDVSFFLIMSRKRQNGRQICGGTCSRSNA